MKFLILTQYFPPEIGAPQVRFSSIVRELVRLGHTVEVVTGMPNHPTGRIFEPYRGKFYLQESFEGARIHRVWIYASLGAGIKRLLNYFSFVFTAFWGLARCQKPDVVIVESPPLFLSITAFMYSRLVRVPYIFNVADLWPDSVRDMGLITNKMVLQIAEVWEKWTYKTAAFINAVTEGISETLTQKKKVPADKVIFLPNGVDTDLFCPRSPELELANELGLANRRLIIYAGTIGYAQGLDVAIGAAEALLKDAKLNDIHFVFIGDGSDKQRLLQRTNELALNNIHFLPPNSPEYVARLYSLAWAGFASLRDLPLFEGARPSKIFPIMASGKPVIYCGRGEAARLLTMAKAGVVAQPEVVDDLVRVIRQLHDNPSLYKSLEQSGREFTVKNYSWSAIVKNYLNELRLRGEKIGVNQLRN